MATTASTSLLGLALPVTGELDGTWGNIVNDSITSLLDSAIAGTTTLSSDGDVTLTTTALTANTAREAILLWTAGGTDTRYITAPAQSKAYIVINQSSGSQSIVLRGAGPTSGITIVKGESAVCVWNGSDFIKAANTFGAGVFTSVTDSALTSGRVTYASTGGLLVDSASLTFNGTTLTASGLNLTGQYTEGVVAIGNSGTAKTIALTNGTVQTVTLTGNCTFTMPTAVAGKSFTLILSTGAGSFTSTFTSVKWPNNTAPTITTTASRWDILSFISDGTNWYGNFAQAYQ